MVLVEACVTILVIADVLDVQVALLLIPKVTLVDLILMELLHVALAVLAVQADVTLVVQELVEKPVLDLVTVDVQTVV